MRYSCVNAWPAPSAARRASLAAGTSSGISAARQIAAGDTVLAASALNCAYICSSHCNASLLTFQSQMPMLAAPVAICTRSSLRCRAR